MIEVFKTNIRKRKDATVVVSSLKTIFPGSFINIDLQDRDKVLKIVTGGQEVNEKKVKEVFTRYNFVCQVLDC